MRSKPSLPGNGPWCDSPAPPVYSPSVAFCLTLRASLSVYRNISSTDIKRARTSGPIMKPTNPNSLIPPRMLKKMASVGNFILPLIRRGSQETINRAYACHPHDQKDYSFAVKALQGEVYHGRAPHDKGAHQRYKRRDAHGKPPHDRRGYPQKRERDSAHQPLDQGNGDSSVDSRHDYISRLANESLPLPPGKGHERTETFEQFRALHKEEEYGKHHKDKVGKGSGGIAESDPDYSHRLFAYFRDIVAYCLRQVLLGHVKYQKHLLHDLVYHRIVKNAAQRVCRTVLKIGGEGNRFLGKNV